MANNQGKRNELATSIVIEPETVTFNRNITTFNEKGAVLNICEKSLAQRLPASVNLADHTVQVIIYNPTRNLVRVPIDALNQR